MEPSILKAPLFFSKPERESIDHGNIYENKTLLAPGCACGVTVLNAIDVYPKIFPADTTAKIQVEGLNPEWLNHSGLSIGYVRDDGTYLNGAQAEWNGWEPVSTFEVEDQILTLTYPLNGEHEHTFRVTGQGCTYLRTGYIFLVVLYDCFCKVCGIGRSCRSISSQPLVGS